MTSFEENRRHLMRVGIVTPNTACASLPFRLHFLKDTYTTEISDTFLNSPWPLDHAPHPLECTYDDFLMRFEYRNSKHTKTRFFETAAAATNSSQRAFSLHIPSTNGDCFVFDEIVQIQGITFRVVQDLLPPLITQDTYTPVLTGGETMSTAANAQPLFSYNTSLGMLEVSPPVFRALSMSMTEQSRREDASFIFTPHLYASLLVRIPGKQAAFGQKEAFSHYCLLQIMDVPSQPFSTLARSPEQKASLSASSKDRFRDLLEIMALQPPYFVPQPLDLSCIYIESSASARPLNLSGCAAFEYGTMTIPLAGVCRGNSRVSGAGGGSSSRAELLENKWFGRYLAQQKTVSALKTSVLVLFSLPWSGERITKLKKPPKRLFHLQRWDNSVLRYQNARLLRIQPLHRFFSLDFQNLRLFAFLAKKGAQINQVKYDFMFSRKLFENSPGVLQARTNMDRELQPCRVDDACGRVYPTITNDISQFEKARNMFLLPNKAILNVEPVFDVQLIRDNRPELYSRVLQPYLIDARMTADCLHYFSLSRQNRPDTASAVILPEGYRLSSKNTNEILDFLLSLDFLSESLKTFVAVRSAIQEEVGNVASSTLESIEKCQSIIEFLAYQIASVSLMLLYTIHDIDQTQTENPEQFFNLESREEFLRDLFKAFEAQISPSYSRALQNSGTVFFEDGVMTLPAIPTNIEERDNILLLIFFLHMTARWTMQHLSLLGTKQTSGYFTRPVQRAQKRLLETVWKIKNWKEYTSRLAFHRLRFFNDRNEKREEWNQALVKETFLMKTSSYRCLQEQPTLPQVRRREQPIPKLFFDQLISLDLPHLFTERIVEDNDVLVFDRKLRFEGGRKIGKGAYGVVYEGKLSIMNGGMGPFPVVYKRINLRQVILNNLHLLEKSLKKKIPLEFAKWKQSHKGFLLVPELLEVVVMTMLERYGRWEEDPYIISPTFFWVGVSNNDDEDEEGEECYLEIFMEYFPAPNFVGFATWMRDEQVSDTARDIVFRRLNRYYHHMAFETLIHLIMNDNFANNILVENSLSTPAEILVIVLIDQALSTVSVPVSELMYSEDVDLEDEDDALEKFAYDGCITFFDDTYETESLIRQESTLHGREFTANMPITPSQPDKWLT